MNEFLNVTKSLSGKRWEAATYDVRAASTIESHLGVPPVIAQLLAARGVTADTANAFLNPRLKDQMPDPSSLKDMDKAVVRFINAVMNKERITVFGDYDIDGASSTALLLRFGRALGADIHPYIPDRIKEGYGPNSNAMQIIKDTGSQLVITVDCGITAHEPLAKAKQLGLDVIILDHHTAEPALPPALAVVNPNRLDEKNNVGTCAAVGVVFMFIIATSRELRARNFYHEKRPEPELMKWLDIVALGTVGDVVPLVGLNRAFVAQGLKVMAQRQNPGLAALSDIGRLAAAPDSFALGFVLGPRVNAGGRVGKADLGTQILSTDDEILARRIASELDAFNTARREIEQGVLDEALAQTEGGSGNMVIAVGKGWHPGVIGVVAGRLKERYHRPTIVIAVDDKGIGKGSGRSIKGVDIGAMCIAARQEGLLINGGGHAMASGLTVEEKMIPALKKFFEDKVSSVLTPEIARPRLVVDALIGMGAMNIQFYQQVQQLAPFGSGNFEPKFALAGLRVVQADLVGTEHVRVTFSDDAGRRVRGIAFRAANDPLGQSLLSQKTAPLHVVGRLSLNTWQGRNEIELMVDDVALA